MARNRGVTVRPYHATDRAVFEILADEFQDFFVTLDPLGRKLRQPGHAEWYTGEMLRLVAEQEGSFLVAEAEGSVVGFVIGLIHNSTTDEEFQTVPTRTGRVQELFVTDSHRSHGIGAALLAAIEARLRAQGCDVIRIEVFAPNKDARRFYERHGYAPREIDQMKVL